MLACRVPWKLIRAIVEREPAAAPTNNAHRGHPIPVRCCRMEKAEAEAPLLGLQKTRLGERVRCALTNHKMVEYPHVDKRQAVFNCSVSKRSALDGSVVPEGADGRR